MTPSPPPLLLVCPPPSYLESLKPDLLDDLHYIGRAFVLVTVWQVVLAVCYWVVVYNYRALRGLVGWGGGGGEEKGEKEE